MASPTKSTVESATDRLQTLANHLSQSSPLPAASPSNNPHSKIRNMGGKQDYKFEGWMGLDKNAAKGEMVWQEYEPKTWTEDDVDIKITHCGICGSDIHTLRSGWVCHPSQLLQIKASKFKD